MRACERVREGLRSWPWLSSLAEVSSLSFSLSESMFTQLYLMTALLQHSALNSRAPAASDKYSKSNRPVFALLLPDRLAVRHRGLMTGRVIFKPCVTWLHANALLPLITAGPIPSQYQLINDRFDWLMSWWLRGQSLWVNLWYRGPPLKQVWWQTFPLCVFYNRCTVFCMHCLSKVWDTVPSYNIVWFSRQILDMSILTW